MLNAAFAHQIVIFCFVGLLLWAAVSDYRLFIIPNWVSLGSLALYPLHVLLSPEPVPWLFSLAMAVFVFLLGCGFFAAKAMGGGDVKLISTTLLWAGPAYYLDFFLATVAGGMALAVVFAMRTSFALAKAEASNTLVATVTGLRHVPVMKLAIPYGVAIAAAGIYVGARLLGV